MGLLEKQGQLAFCCCMGSGSHCAVHLQMYGWNKYTAMIDKVFCAVFVAENLLLFDMFVKLCHGLVLTEALTPPLLQQTNFHVLRVCNWSLLYSSQKKVLCLNAGILPLQYLSTLFA